MNNIRKAIKRLTPKRFLKSTPNKKLKKSSSLTSPDSKECKKTKSPLNVIKSFTKLKKKDKDKHLLSNSESDFNRVRSRPIYSMEDQNLDKSGKNEANPRASNPHEPIDDKNNNNIIQKHLNLDESVTLMSISKDSNDRDMIRPTSSCISPKLVDLNFLKTEKSVRACKRVHFFIEDTDKDLIELRYEKKIDFTVVDSSELVGSIEISKVQLEAFYEIFEDPFIERLLTVDCCFLVTDKTSIAAVLLYLLRSKVDSTHYRSLFLIFLYLVISFLDATKYKAHLLTWIYEDAQISNELFPRKKFTNPQVSQGTTVSHTLPVTKITSIKSPRIFTLNEISSIKQTLETLIFQISNELLNFRLHFEPIVLEKLINLNWNFKCWKRVRNEFHSHRLTEDFEHFSNNNKGSHCDRFKCPLKNCRNFFEYELKSQNNFSKDLEQEKIKKQLKFETQIIVSSCSKRPSDSEASYYVPTKRRKLVNSLSETFSNFTLSEVGED